MKEFDSVVLTRRMPKTKLKAGDIGTVVHRYPGGGYEVEFLVGSGDTVAVLTLPEKHLRPMAPSEILHARELE